MNSFIGLKIMMKLEINSKSLSKTKEIIEDDHLDSIEATEIKMLLRKSQIRRLHEKNNTFLVSNVFYPKPCWSN